MSVPGVIESSEADTAGGALVEGVVAALRGWCDDMGIPQDLRAQAVMALADVSAA